MKVSVIVPVFNESQTIERILTEIDEVDLDTIDKEVVIVDDGSTDGTREKLVSIGNNKENRKFVFLGSNCGKGTAIREGLKSASGDIVIIQDADLEYDPQDYSKLIEPIINEHAQVVYGSRVLGFKSGKIQWNRYRLAQWLLTSLANILYGANITDEPTCYKVFKTNVIKSLNLKCTGFEFCPEVTAKIRKKNYNIYEVPISYHPRSIKEGKKIRFKDGLIAIYVLLKYRFIDD